METAVQVFNNEEFGEVRTVTIDGVIYLVGKDVATALGYKDTKSAIIDHVDDEDKRGWQIATSGQRREMTVINESGLYSLILSSKLPNAKKFKHWVTSEVLSTIRKTGSYSVKPVTTLTALEQTITVLKEQDARIKAVEDEQRQQRMMMEWLNPIKGETQRQMLVRLVKELATTYPNYEENKPAAHRQAWHDFISNVDNDQHIKIQLRVKNRGCKTIDILEQDNLLTQSVSIISNMLVKVKKRFSNISN